MRLHIMLAALLAATSLSVPAFADDADGGRGSGWQGRAATAPPAARGGGLGNAGAGRDGGSRGARPGGNAGWARPVARPADRTPDNRRVDNAPGNGNRFFGGSWRARPNADDRGRTGDGGNRRFDRTRNDNVRNNFWGNNAWRNNDQRWNRNWRSDNRYDWQRYRQYNRNVYRLPRYDEPFGYHHGYQRFSIGLFLGSSFYGQNYWINDASGYRLPDVSPPYRWVRYYNDVLLIDTGSGEVVDVIHDFFW